MLSSNQIKYFSSLRQKKNRNKYNSFLAEGDKMVKELILSPGGLLNLKTLLILPEFLESFETFPDNLKIVPISKKELKRISTLSTPNKAILEIGIPDYSYSLEEIKNEYSIFLEDIKDPGNLGSIIRTADWFGIRNIFCTTESVDVFNPKVIQASMGSFSRVKVHYMDPFFLLDEISSLPSSYQTIGTVLNGKVIYELQLSGCGLIFFGNESKGLSSEISDRTDFKITIPGYSGKSGAESLNLSIAVGIVGSEVLRKKIIQNEN